jgi:short-subunit dehydrogenase
MKGSSRQFAQTPDEVAEEAFRRNDKGAEIVVPGLLPKVAAAFLRYTPEICMRALTRPAAEKYYVGD